MITATELRNKIDGMNELEVISLRDELENNWSESLRPIMKILSLGSIKNFNKTLSSL